MLKDREITKVETYWKDAQDFVRLTTDHGKEPWFALTLEMPELLSDWKQYFAQRLGFMPRGIGLLEEQKISCFLVPCERPESFDGTFNLRRLSHG